MRELFAVFTSDKEIIRTPAWVARKCARWAFAVSVGQPVIPSPLDIYAAIALYLHEVSKEAMRSQMQVQMELEAAVERFGLVETERRYTQRRPQI